MIRSMTVAVLLLLRDYISRPVQQNRDSHGADSSACKLDKLSRQVRKVSSKEHLPASDRKMRYFHHKHGKIYRLLKASLESLITRGPDAMPDFPLIKRYSPVFSALNRPSALDPKVHVISTERHLDKK